MVPDAHRDAACVEELAGVVRVHAVRAGSRLTIDAPPGTTSVRGTAFRLALEEGGAKLDTEVLSGAVVPGRDVTWRVTVTTATASACSQK